MRLQLPRALICLPSKTKEARRLVRNREAKLEEETKSTLGQAGEAAAADADAPQAALPSVAEQSQDLLDMVEKLFSRLCRPARP